jgi:hypothetical protein
MKVNFVGKCIEVSNAEMKRAQNPGSQEYFKLMQTMKELAEFQIVVKQSTRKAYNTHAGLTYEFMEDFVKAIAPERVPEFQSIRSCYRSYPSVKQWFLKEFPEVNENLWFVD